mmetsp:Transcript_36125/g.95096  ORF Transcript_36125/g.95096 Transcript_36125/m.95096 type:complete len:494 (-) Transcript_36125:989-2470(-)
MVSLSHKVDSSICMTNAGTQSPQSGLTKALSSEEQTVSTPVVGNASAQSEAGGLKSQQHVSCKPFGFEERGYSFPCYTSKRRSDGAYEGRQYSRLDAFIAFLTRNSRLLQLQRQQLRQDNKTLRVAMNRCGYLPSQVHAGCLPATDTKEEADSSALRSYDAVLHVQTITDLLHGGWRFHLSPDLLPSFDSIFSNESMQATKSFDTQSEAQTNTSLQDALGLFPSDVPVVGVLGIFNTGKTFLLNRLCDTSLPSSKKDKTRGLSLCRATMAATPVTLLDCEGSLAPAALTALPERQATENVLERLSVCIADYLVYVVDDFTSVDQRAVHRLTQMMRTKSSKQAQGFAELVVVHNMRTVADVASLQDAWHSQVTRLHGYGEQQESMVAMPASGNKSPIQSKVVWFKTHSTRHLLLAQQVSEGGSQCNAPTIALLRMWIQSAYIPMKTHHEGLLGKVLRAVKQTVEETINQKVELLVQRSSGVVEPHRLKSEIVAF